MKTFAWFWGGAGIVAERFQFTTGAIERVAVLSWTVPIIRLPARLVANSWYQTVSLYDDFDHYIFVWMSLSKLYWQNRTNKFLIMYLIVRGRLTIILQIDTINYFDKSYNTK